MRLKWASFWNPQRAPIDRTARLSQRGSARSRRARARRRRLGRGLTYVAAFLLALWVLAPIYLITITAFSPRSVVYGYPKDAAARVAHATIQAWLNANARPRVVVLCVFSEGDLELHRRIAEETFGPAG